MDKEKIRFAKLHSDSEFVDEVKISTVPSYKESHMSGDEWRTSAVVQFSWKGNVVFQTSFNNVQTAATFVPVLLLTIGEEGKSEHPKDSLEYCFQPGCSNKSVSEFELIKEYGREGKGWTPTFKKYRRFCEKHIVRGDSDLEDCDSNYIDVTAKEDET